MPKRPKGHPTSAQRLKVWRGELERTSGGLTKAMLTRNKRGKIVSRKKSRQAASANNLGKWLHASGVTVPKGEMIRYKSNPPSGVKAEKPQEKKKPEAPVKPKAKAKQAAPKPKPKPAPKPKPPKTPKPAVHKPKPKPHRQAPKKARRKRAPKINPITNEPYEKMSRPGGFVATGNVNVDNIQTGRRRRATQSFVF